MQEETKVNDCKTEDTVSFARPSTGWTPTIKKKKAKTKTTGDLFSSHSLRIL